MSILTRNFMLSVRENRWKDATVWYCGCDLAFIREHPPLNSDSTFVIRFDNLIGEHTKKIIYSMTVLRSRDLIEVEYVAVEDAHYGLNK